MMPSPELRRAFSIGDARRIWKRYGFTSPRDLVLEDLAFALGVVVIEEPLESADARLIRGATRGIIRVNSGIPWEGRKRFAIAHELGHWHLHAKISQLLACTSEDMRALYKDSEHEGEANWFAAELLMPETMFKEACRGTAPEPDLIHRLADRFLVTRTAAAVRYVEVCPAHSVLVMCMNGRIKWWRCSKELDGPLWIAAGAAVPERSLAAAYFAGKDVDGQMQTIGMDDWATRFPEFAEEVNEALVPLGNTGAAIVMLWVE